MALQFPADEYKTPGVSKFFAALQQFEAKIKQDAIANSKEWFGKQMSKEIVSEFYRRLVKSNNPAYPPVMKVKVQLNDGQPNAAFFDEARRSVTIDYLVKNTSVKMIIEADRLWFINKARVLSMSACLFVFCRQQARV